MITKEIICKELPELWRENKRMLLYLILGLFLIIPCALIVDGYNKLFMKRRKHDG